MLKTDNKLHGSPCKRCGNTLRYISGNTCVRCRKNYGKSEYIVFRGERLLSTNKWHADNREHHNELMRVGQLRRKFGLSADEYADLVAKHGGVCRICQHACPTGRRLAVDHDHKTGKVRGLLCQGCNTGIGKFADDPARLMAAARYLLSHQSPGATIGLIHKPPKERAITCSSSDAA